MLRILFIGLLFINASLSVPAKPWVPDPGHWWQNWMKIHESLVSNTKTDKDQIKAVFIGASITNFWGGAGKALWDSYYAPKGAANYGIPGDSTSYVLWRIENHELDGLKPKVFIFSCGAGYNTMHSPDPNINKFPPPTRAEVTKGLMEIIKQLRTRFSESKVIIIGMTPYRDPNLKAEAKLINEELKKNSDEKNVFFLNLIPHMVDSKGEQIKNLFTDGLHFTLEGYKIWHKTMKPLFEKLMK